MGSRQFGIQEGRLALQRRLENGARPIKDLRHETGTKFLKTGPNCGSWVRASRRYAGLRSPPNNKVSATISLYRSNTESRYFTRAISRVTVAQLSHGFMNKRTRRPLPVRP